MKIENKIEEKDEQLQKLEILNQNSNSTLLRVNPWIDELFSLPWSTPMEKPRNCVQEIERPKWKEKKEWRTIERKREIRENLHNK